MEINLPAIVAEVSLASDRYEQALIANDVVVLDELFWSSPHTLRYGATENLYGIEAIREFRSQRGAQGLARSVARRVITTFGSDFATVNIEFARAGDARVGRQSQSWARIEACWRVVAAHVSYLERGH
jgi:hypothetical protein